MLFFTRLLALAVLQYSASAAIVPVKPVPAFQGPQSGIGSWYQANSARDGTNGKSWCGFAYADADPLFAPSLAAMGGATYSSNPTAWRQQTGTYCGLEANVTNPKTGVSTLLYIGDSFSQPRTPGSIDILLGPFVGVYGSNPNQNKNLVVNPINWYLTGNINTDWIAQGDIVSTRTAAGGTTSTPLPSSTTSSSVASSTCQS
ncbi:hypothetical protein MMC25_004620 [Agyrium rufum]|nr:hypothetical protein [Agyrium rufum]